ncbi:MAG: hypothetical protein Q8R28_16875, partial [Dehalococcoidia bacterium]|nr:hypothetical protein [Dehalococcoidia bacterium]
VKEHEPEIAEIEAERDALRERNRALVEALQVIFRRGYHGASYVAQLALAADAKAGKDADGRG